MVLIVGLDRARDALNQPYLSSLFENQTNGLRKLLAKVKCTTRLLKTFFVNLVILVKIAL